MNAHFFDLNTAIRVESEVWIVSKKNPNTPIVKISQSEFNLIRKSIYKYKGSSLKIGDIEYWIDTDLFQKIKTRCKNLKIDITTLNFSLQEFMNPELIEELDYKIWKEHFLNLKNTNDDIYFICSKNTKRNYEKIISKLEHFLKEELGLSVKNYYFISETFYNRDKDKISHKKLRLILQHLIGQKTEGDKFTDEEITQYQKINFYDDDVKTLSLSKSINDMLRFILSNSDEEIKNKIEELVKRSDIVLEINSVTYNKVNLFKKEIIKIGLERIVKTYESFIRKF